MKLASFAQFALLIGLYACTPATLQTEVEPVMSADSASPAAAEGSEAGDVAEIGEAAIASLNSVPPGGAESLTPGGLSYFQGMGPLEYATRLTGEPDFPTWRVRLQLIPQDTGERDGFSYLVKNDHYNLSPALYNSLVASYGDNADPSLNDTRPHQGFLLSFMPIMSIAADWRKESTQFTQFPLEEDIACDTIAELQLKCAELMGRQIEDGKWEEAGRVSVDAAPWESEKAPLHSVVRILAQSAGKLKGSGNAAFWTNGEISESAFNLSPWVEVIVDNYPGNGGGYQGLWVERVDDDSISSVVHHVYYDGVGTEAQGLLRKGVVCRRGENAGKIQTSCP